MLSVSRHILLVTSEQLSVVYLTSVDLFVDSDSTSIDSIDLNHLSIEWSVNIHYGALQSGVY